VQVKPPENIPGFACHYDSILEQRKMFLETRAKRHNKSDAMKCVNLSWVRRIDSSDTGNDGRFAQGITACNASLAATSLPKNVVCNIEPLRKDL